MTSKVIFFTHDRSGEKSSVAFTLRDAASGGEYNNRLTEIGTLQAALDAMCLSDFASYDFISRTYLETGSLPTSPYAQREQRALFDCVAANGERFKVGIPCPDLDNMGLPGTDAINLTDPQVSAYVATLEAEAVSPRFGTALTVIGGKIVGIGN